MIVHIDKSFDKDISKVKIASIRKKVAAVIEQVMAANNKEEIPHLKKIQGYETYYRIRVGDYRIGLEIIEEEENDQEEKEEQNVEGGIAYFIRFLHRKDIYRYFP